MQRVFGWDSTGAGLIFLPIVIPAFASPVVGNDFTFHPHNLLHQANLYPGALADRYGPRWLTTAGFLLGVPFFVLLRYITYNSIGQKVLLCFFLFAVGFSLTLMMTPIVAEITYVVEAKERGRPGIFGPSGAYAQAYALFNMAFAAGTLVGPLWGGLVEEKAGWSTMVWTLGLLSAVSAIPTVRILSHPCDGVSGGQTWGITYADGGTMLLGSVHGRIDHTTECKVWRGEGDGCA